MKIKFLLFWVGSLCFPFLLCCTDRMEENFEPPALRQQGGSKVPSLQQRDQETRALSSFSQDALSLTVTQRGEGWFGWIHPIGRTRYYLSNLFSSAQWDGGYHKQRAMGGGVSLGCRFGKLDFIFQGDYGMTRLGLLPLHGEWQGEVEDGTTPMQENIIPLHMESQPSPSTFSRVWDSMKEKYTKWYEDQADQYKREREEIIKLYEENISRSPWKKALVERVLRLEREPQQEERNHDSVPLEEVQMKEEVANRREHQTTSFTHEVRFSSLTLKAGHSGAWRSKRVAISPSVLIKSLKLGVREEINLVPSGPSVLPLGETNVAFRSNYWGIGPGVGIEGVGRLTSHLSLYGRCDWAMTCGRTRIRSLGEPILPEPIEESKPQYVALYELSLGMRWKRSMRHVAALSVHGAWKCQGWNHIGGKVWDLPELNRPLNAFYHGLILGMGLDF